MYYFQLTHNFFTAQGYKNKFSELTVFVYQTYVSKIKKKKKYSMYTEPLGWEKGVGVGEDIFMFEGRTSLLIIK